MAIGLAPFSGRLQVRICCVCLNLRGKRTPIELFVCNIFQLSTADKNIISIPGFQIWNKAMAKRYVVKINGTRIGYTEFESGDPPMGVVFGVMIFDDIKSGYAFLKEYCNKHNVVINEEDGEFRYISSQGLPGVVIESEDGTQIKGLATNIRGSDEGWFEVEVIGISNPLYDKEFSHHREKYNDWHRE